MTTSVSAGSSAPLGNDQFDLIVLDFEGLTQIWRNLATTKASCKDIRNLVYIKKDEIISSFDRVEIPHIPLTAFEHLIKAFANTPFLVSNEARRMRLAALCGSLVEHGTSSHPAISPRATITRSQGKSELERLENLNRWVTIKRTLEDTLDGSGRAVECLRKIIAYDLREIRHNSVTSDDATSLRALELAANTRTGVAEEDRSLIDKIISSKISSLKYSENASFSVSHTRCTARSLLLMSSRASPLRTTLKGASIRQRWMSASV